MADITEPLTELQKVSEETMRFMRGKYLLDEVAGKYYDIDCLKFRQGKRAILSINIHEDRYDLQIIFGKAEREKFEARRAEFSPAMQTVYDSNETVSDGKWMLIPVADMETLEEVKKLILIKKNPNRKPFPKEQAVYADCGHRCDLCIHYTGETISEAFRAELCERLTRVYNHDDWSMRCPGCKDNPFEGANGEPCWQKKCAAGKNVTRCMECGEFGTCNPQVGLREGIKWKNTLAADVTWAILPYVDGQYGN